ncbi:5-carboxymethyl-2-hydroxymuconate Delta-isomerase [Streptomyces filamentosus]|uniref:Isomerase n=1 Tax=Streptomyces filamentosus TaxID=67294 RepID=A0A919BUV5_STRFL|nr:isomerase [Streptomyces filamentosus]GHG16524.1 isomerase [Streptomyces filamentosus]
MPQITVDYSAPLDRRGFALALHPLVAEATGAPLSACATRFREVEETVVGDGATERAVVHVDIVVRFGRTDDDKRRLSKAVLALLPRHLKTAERARLSVEVRDFENSYLEG